MAGGSSKKGLGKIISRWYGRIPYVRDRRIREHNERASHEALQKVREKYKDTYSEIKAAYRRVDLPPLEGLTDDQLRSLETYTGQLWLHLNKLMTNAGPGGMSYPELSWKMEMKVQDLAQSCPSEDRGLVMVASHRIQTRFRALLRAAMKTDEGKRVLIDEEAREARGLRDEGND